MPPLVVSSPRLRILTLFGTANYPTFALSTSVHTNVRSIPCPFPLYDRSTVTKLIYGLTYAGVGWALWEVIFPERAQDTYTWLRNNRRRHGR